MKKYIIKRLGVSIIVFVGITFAVYTLSALAPGSPTDQLAAAGNMSEAEIEALKVSLGLDKPIVVRYGIWISELAKGEFGTSYKTGQPVWSMIKQRIAPSLTLTLSALAIALIAAIPLGIVSAAKPRSACDYIASALSFLAQSVPNFFLSLICLYLFAIKLRLLPTSGMYNTTGKKEFLDLLRHLIIPATVMSFQLMGSFIRYTRSSMLEVLNEEYIKTARAKGISNMAVTIRHAFRNSLIPVITAVGLQVPALVGGAVVTEQIFGWPGMGSLMISSIDTHDYPTIMGIAVMIATVVLITNILLDIIYAYLDPRIGFD